MNTRYLLLVITVLVFLGFASCKKFLDIKPKGNVIPETVDHYEGMLNNVIQGYFCHFQDYLSDDAALPSDGSGSATDLYMSANPNGMNHVVRRIFKFNPVPFEAVDSDMMWTQTHRSILHFNTVIEYVMTSEGGTEAKKRSLRAEALLQRAIDFYGLVNIYARHYDATTAATEPGVPMFLHPDVTTSVPRSTVKEVYDRILDDVEQALPDLPQTPVLGKFRASYPGAIAFLARVHLTMGNYETALEYADEALGYNSTLVDLNGQKIAPVDPPSPYTGLSGLSVDWVLNLDNSPVPNANEHPETILARTFVSPYGLGTAANVCMSEELRELFDQANDKRYQFWYASGRPSINCEQLYGLKIRLRGDQFNIGPGTAEMYLIRAECNARAGQLQAALDDVNDLREKRFTTGTIVDKTLADCGNDAFEVLKFVLEERRRELAFMGFRVTDLKRLNKDADSRLHKTVTHVTPEGTFTLVPNSNKYLRQLYPGATIYHPDWELNPITD
ncbi:MAG: RagB/SusD family nutrient uptake outer membrane protein [Bacteroidales bacterium]|jgi:tetratricopeptide (TPR) repeat protein|nr:RagB/SusD family nutrient uptake outer membrane protein [Bacteroidales bacterium]